MITLLLALSLCLFLLLRRVLFIQKYLFKLSHVTGTVLGPRDTSDKNKISFPHYILVGTTELYNMTYLYA